MLHLSHLDKAKRLEESASILDPARHYETIIEALYGAALHYIACICEKRIHKHQDTHKGLAKFLDDNGLAAEADAFRRLDHLRMSRWYGGQGNGDVVMKAIGILEELKREVWVHGR